MWLIMWDGECSRSCWFDTCKFPSKTDALAWFASEALPSDGISIDDISEYEDGEYGGHCYSETSGRWYFWFPIRDDTRYIVVDADEYGDVLLESTNYEAARNFSLQQLEVREQQKGEYIATDTADANQACYIVPVGK